MSIDGRPEIKIGTNIFPHQGRTFPKNTLNFRDLPDEILLKIGHIGEVFCIRMYEYYLDDDVSKTKLCYVVSGGEDATVRIWSQSSGTLLKTLRGHASAVTEVVCFRWNSRNLHVIASTSWDHTVKLWDLRTGHCLSTFRGHSDAIIGCEVCVDDETLLTCSGDTTVRIWNFEGQCLQTLSNHTAGVFAVRVGVNTKECTALRPGWPRAICNVDKNSNNDEYNSKGDLKVQPMHCIEWIVTGSLDKTISVWRVQEDLDCDVRTRNHSDLLTTQYHSHSISNSIHVRSSLQSHIMRDRSQSLDDTDHANTNTNTNTDLIDNDIGLVQDEPEDENTNNNININISDADDDELNMNMNFDNNDGLLQAESLYDNVVLSPTPLSSSTSASSSSYYLSNSPSNAVSVSVQQHQQVTAQAQHSTSSYNSMQMALADYKISIESSSSSSSTNIASKYEHVIRASHKHNSSKDKLDVNDGDDADDIYTVLDFNPPLKIRHRKAKLIKVLRGHKSAVCDVRLDNRDHVKMLASGSWDGTIRIWSMTTFNCTRILRGHTDAVIALQISFDNNMLISGSPDGHIYIWELDSGTIRKSIDGQIIFVSALDYHYGRLCLGSGYNECAFRMLDFAHNIHDVKIPQTSPMYRRGCDILCSHFPSWCNIL